MKTKNEIFESKMLKHYNNFDKLWTKIVKDVNNFVEDPEHSKIYSLQKTEKLIDTLILSGSWINDRIEDKSGIPGNSKYRGSLTKKTRKALGYTL